MLNRSCTACIVAIEFLLISTPAQAAEFIPLGYLPGGFFSGAASDVSADGNVVVGRSHSAEAGFEAFRWTRSSGLVGLGDFPTADALSDATAVSGDASVIVGRGTAVFYALVDGFRWTEETGLELLGYFPRSGTLFSYPGAISNDGRVIVGSSDNRIFRWTEQNGISEIPEISSQTESSYAAGVSADGSVIAGSREVQGLQRPFRFSAPDQIDEIGLLPDWQVDTFASALSSNGQVVVGSAGGQGWRWDETTGLESLPRLQEYDLAVYPVDVTADGSVIVGTTTASTDPAARFTSFIWSRERGTENLETFLQEQYGLTTDGWSLTRVSGISDDGMVIVGGGVNPKGRPEAWVVDLRIPEPAAIVPAVLGMLFIGVMRRQSTASHGAHRQSFPFLNQYGKVSNVGCEPGDTQPSLGG